MKPPRNDWPTELEHGINIKYYITLLPQDINPFINHDGRIEFDKYNDRIPTPRLLSFLKSESHLWEQLQDGWYNMAEDQKEEMWNATLMRSRL